jgi:hypothetical protein
LDFVAVGLVFVAMDLVFVAPNFDFIVRPCSPLRLSTIPAPAALGGVV